MTRRRTEIRLWSYGNFDCFLYVSSRETTSITAQNAKLSISDFFSKYDQKTAYLIIFTEKNFNEELQFLCSVVSVNYIIFSLQIFSDIS